MSSVGGSWENEKEAEARGALKESSLRMSISNFSLFRRQILREERLSVVCLRDTKITGSHFSVVRGKRKG